MTQIKGFAIRGLLKYIKTSGHPGGIPAVVATLPAEIKTVYDKPIINSSWYPYRAFTTLLRAVDKQLGKGDLALMEEIGRRSGKEDLGSVFKVFAAVFSIETIIKRSPIFWQKYCDTGAIEVIEMGDHTFRCALKGVPDVDQAQCNLIAGWIKGIGEATGAKAIEVKQIKCLHRGHPWCEYEARWR